MQKLGYYFCMKTFINEPDNTPRLKDTKIVFERNTDFGIPPEGKEFLRKWKSIGFVIKGIPGTNEFVAGSFGASGDRDKLISQYETMYISDRWGTLMRRRTEKKVTNLELIIKWEIWVDLEKKSEKRKIIVIRPAVLWADWEAPMEYEVDILTIETPKDAEGVQNDTKARTKEALHA